MSPPEFLIVAGQTVIKEKNVATNAKEQSGFTAHLDALNKVGITVPYVAKLQELNKARVGFKHYGNLPARDEAKKHQNYVEDFLIVATSEHFGITFDDLSLVDLVADEEIRNFLKSAEEKSKVGAHAEAMAECGKARSTLFGKLSKFVPKVDKNLRDVDRLLSNIEGFRTAKPFAYIAEYLAILRETSLVTLLRLPPEDYEFLKEMLPSTIKTMAGTWYVTHSRSQYGDTDCRRAITCIVNLCVSLEAYASKT